MLYVIAGIVFLDMFAQFPVMSPFAQSLGASSVMIGIVMGSYSFTNLFGNIMAGKWIDRHGARNILVIGMIVTSIIFMCYTFVHTPAQLVLVRLAHGLSSGLLAPGIFTLLANIRRSKQRSFGHGKNMALSGAAIGITAVVGPAFSGVMMGIFHIQAVFVSVSFILLLGGLYIGVITRHVDVEKKSETGAKTESTITRLLQVINRRTIQSYIGAFSLMVVMGVLTYMLPLKVLQLSFADMNTGLLLSTFGVVAVLVFLLPTNRLFDRLNLDLSMLLGFSLLAVSIWLLSVCSGIVWMYISMSIYGLGFAVIFPSISRNLIEHVSDDYRGQAFGIFYGVFSVGVVVGSVVIGLIASHADDGFRFAAMFLTIVAPTIFIMGKRNVLRIRFVNR